MVPAVKLAGRCLCGVLETLAKGDEHLACRGDRRCRRCETVKPIEEFPQVKGEAGPRHVCRVCTRELKAAAYERRLTPEERARLNEYSRLRYRALTRANAPQYLRHLAYKRDRYRHDAEYRARENARSRAHKEAARQAGREAA